MRFWLIFSLILLLISIVQVSAQDLTEKGRRALYVYTDKEGLPQNSINDIAFDQKGYLWVATQDGAAFYNGRIWQIVNMPNRTRSNYVTDILVASDNSIWFATLGNGVSRLKDEKWSTFTTDNGLPSNQTWCLLENRSDNNSSIIWLGTQKGLVSYQNGSWKTETAFEKLPNNQIRALAESGNGREKTLWVGTDGGGLFYRQKDKWGHFDTSNGLPNNSVLKILVNNQHNETELWIGTQDGLGHYHKGGWNSFTTKSGLPSNTIRCLLMTKSALNKDVLWVGTSGGGLARYENGKWQSFNTQTGLPDNSVWSLLETNKGSHALWIGTAGGGLTRFEQGRWVSFDTRLGLPNNIVFSIQEIPNKETAPDFWVGTDGGLARYNNNGLWENFDTSKLPNNVIRCILPTLDKAGVWVGTDSGLVRYEDGKWQVFGDESGLPNSAVRALTYGTLNKNEVLWVGTSNGLFYSKNEGWERLDLPSDLASDQILSLLKTTSQKGQETLWIGTNGGGLGCYQEGKWQVFNTNSGLPNNLIRSLLETTTADGSHYLWIGTSGGVTRINLTNVKEKWLTLSDSTNPALPNNVIYQIRSDALGRIYLFTNKGIARLLADVTDKEKFQIYTFTIEDGLPSNECDQGASLLDSQGRIWAGTVGGVAILDTQSEMVEKALKPVYIEKARILSDDSKITENIELSYKQNKIAFDYALLSYFREKDTRYQTQLVGFDETPSDWTDKSTKEYTNLPGGKYKFRVWGRDYLGNEYGPAEISFSIKTAPWKSWWAYLAYILGVIGLAYLVYAWRIHLLKQREEERLGYLRQLLESTRVINSQLDLTVVLEKIAEQSALLVDGEPGGIGLVKGDEVVFERIWHENKWHPYRVSIAKGKGIAGMVAQTGKTCLVNDLKIEPIATFSDSRIAEYFANGFMDVPIINYEGKVVGVLNVRRRRGGKLFDAEKQQLIESFAHQAAVVIEKADLYGELEEKNVVISESLKELEKLYQNELKVIESLEKLSEMKSNFISVISHEMRTPLTVLKGSLEALLDGGIGKLTNLQNRRLSSCLKMTDRLITTLNDVLEILKISENKYELKMSEISMRSLVQSVIDELNIFIEQRNQTVSLDIPESLPLIFADSGKIRLVMLNLIQNAIKFTHDSGKITVKMFTETKNLHIIVEDEGIGISEEDLEQVFEKFYTGSNTDNHSSGKFQFNSRGMGLGLNIAKGYVEAHKGRIWAESPGIGKGSCFHVLLPCVNVLTESSLTAQEISNI